MRRPVLCLILLASCNQAVPLREPEPLERVPALEKRVSIHATGSLPELLSVLGKRVDVPLLLHRGWKREETMSFTFSLDLEDVRASSAIRWLARITNTHAAYRDGVVQFGPEWLVEPPVTAAYDVRALTMEHVDQFSPGLRFARWNGPGFELEDEHPILTTLAEETEVADSFREDQDWAYILRDFADSGTWDGHYTGEIDLHRQLVVVHQPAVHRRLKELLAAFAPFERRRVAFSAEIGDAVDGAPVGRPLSAAEASALEEKLRVHPTRRLECSAAPGQAAKALIRRSMADLSTAEMSILQGRAHRTKPGTISVDVRLSLGTTEAGPRPDSALIRLETQLEVPDGGGIVMLLPGSSGDRGPSRLCLIRASESPCPPLKPVVLSPSPPRDEALMEKLRSMPPVSVELRDVTIEVFAAWLRRVLGVNVVVTLPQPERVTIVAGQVQPLKLLELALGNWPLAWTTRDDAIEITSSSSVARERTSVAVIPVDDLADSALHHPGPRSPENLDQWTGEDLANWIKNTVHKDQWEEADGRMILYDFNHRLLLIRNSPEMIAEILETLEGLRRKLPPAMAISARLLSLSPEMLQQVLGRRNPDETVDAAAMDLLERSGRVVERLDWTAMAGQITCPVWERSFEPAEGAQPSKRTKSWLEVQPRIPREGDGVEVSVKFGDQQLRDGALLSASGQGTALLPPGRWWMTVWSEGGRAGLLAVRAERITSRR